MPRFFLPACACPPEDAVGRTVYIEGSDARHIGLSLRMRCGDLLQVSDGKAREYQCVIRSIEPERVGLEVLSVCQTAKESPCRIHVYQAFCKGEKMDEIVQKSVELGAASVTPVYSDHIVSRPDEKSAKKKQERWQKIAHEAAKQCGRGILPEVCAPLCFGEALVQMKENELCFVCYENEKHRSVKELLEHTPSSCAFFVGPEGGLSAKEVDTLDGMGIPRVTLGSRILRAQTAAPCVLSMLLYCWEL